MNKFTLPRSARHRSSTHNGPPRSPWAPAAMVGAITLTGLACVTAPWSAVAAELPIGLGTAGAYSVLGGQTVTNTGPTGLGAGLGVSPGTAIVGFPPGVALGPITAGDAAALQAQSDLTVAYNDAAGRAPTESVAGDLVGRTLVPGVYNSSGPLALSGNLTLDAQGDPNAVFIFQVASELITASGSSVTLVNGARACNVYWQIGSSATLGTASAFKGTVLALTSITVTTAASVEGRALARNGAVTLDNNSFVTNTCAAVASPGPTATPTPTPTATPTITAPVPQPTETLPAPVPTPTITAPVPQPTETLPAPVPTPTITGPVNPAPTTAPVPRRGGGTGDSGSGPEDAGDSGARDSSPGEVPAGTNRGTNIQTAVSAPAEPGLNASMLYLGAAGACLLVAGITSRHRRATHRVEPVRGPDDPR